MNVNFRRAGLSDVTEFTSVLNSVIVEKVFLSTTKEKSDLDISSFVEAIVKNNWPQQFALINENIVGWCDISPGTPAEQSHVGCLGMGILRHYRGKGIGSKLVESCLNQAELFGFEKVELEVYGDNQAAIRVYEQQGFTLEGRKLRGRKLNDCYQDILQMATFLPRGPA